MLGHVKRRALSSGVGSWFNDASAYVPSRERRRGSDHGQTIQKGRRAVVIKTRFSISADGYVTTPDGRPSLNHVLTAMPDGIAVSFTGKQIDEVEFVH